MIFQCVVLPLELAIRSELQASLPKGSITQSDSAEHNTRSNHGGTTEDIVIDLTDTSSGEEIPELVKRNKLSRRKSSIGHTAIR